MSIEDALLKNIQTPVKTTPVFHLGRMTRVISRIDVNFPSELDHWLSTKCLVIDIVERGLGHREHCYEVLHPTKHTYCEFKLEDLDLRCKSSDTQLSKHLDMCQYRTALITRIEAQLSRYPQLNRRDWILRGMNAMRHYHKYNVTEMRALFMTVKTNESLCEDSVRCYQWMAENYLNSNDNYLLLLFTFARLHKS
jgi:hypothetical protein